MDLNALNNQVLQAQNYSSSSSDDESHTDDSEKEQKEDDSTSESEVEEEEDLLQQHLDAEGIINQDPTKNMVFVNTKKNKKKKVADYDKTQGKMLDIPKEIKSCFDKGYKAHTVQKVINEEFDDTAKCCCFPAYLWICNKNGNAAKNTVLKMEIRDNKLALHGSEYLHCDHSQANEHMLFRMDGNLTNQPPQMVYDEVGEAKIAESNNACWMEVNEKSKGLRFIKKCSITDEISSQLQIWPAEEKSENGEIMLHVKNMRYPRDGVRVGIEAIYAFTNDKTVAEKY